MKAVSYLLAAGLAVAGAEARAQEYAYMMSAGELRRTIDQGNKNLAIGYIAGVMDTLMRSRDFCVPPGESAGEIGNRAYRMIAQQPRESMAPAADVLTVFLHGDFPCGK